MYWIRAIESLADPDNVRLSSDAEHIKVIDTRWPQDRLTADPCLMMPALGLADSCILQP